MVKKNLMLKNNRGFTFVELIIIMGIMTLLMMITTVNLLPIKQKVSLSTTVQSLITDIKQQQLKAMSGETGQGIYFDPDQKNYYVFKGSVYDPLNPTNFKISLDEQIIIVSLDFTDRQMIFLPESGEIGSFNPSFALNKIIFQNIASGEQRTVSINKFGVVANVQ